jgi:hypothetical protein
MKDGTINGGKVEAGKKGASPDSLNADRAFILKKEENSGCLSVIYN